MEETAFAPRNTELEREKKRENNGGGKRGMCI